jgi:hypothetical protein
MAGWSTEELKYEEYIGYDHLQKFIQKAARSQEIANRKTEEKSQSDAASNSYFVEAKAAL